MRAFVFPGQGSQSVGMGRDLAEAFPAVRLVFEEVEEALHERLTRVMFEGPAEVLALTEYAQPALMAVSVSIIRVLESEGGIDLPSTCTYVAGHSLGEYSALAAAGTFSIADAARLLKTRGRAMQRAVPIGEGAMAALMGPDLDVAGEIAAAAAEDEVCGIANDNAPGQVVVSGDREAVRRAVAIAAERGFKRNVFLPVSAPFHCPLMAPAAEVMAEALSDVPMASPRVPVVANVTAAPEDDPKQIRRLLVEQVTAMVRWRESVLNMRAAGIDGVVEIGTGKVLSGLVRRIDRGMDAVSIATPEDIETFLTTDFAPVRSGQVV